MAAATNLIPWAPVESDQRWQEAPAYLRDEFLTQWETANTERAAGDTAIIDKIKGHAASIRAELYGKDSSTGVPAAVSELQGVVDAQSPEEKRKAMFGRIKAASAAREPERIAEQTELESLPPGFRNNLNIEFITNDAGDVTGKKIKISPTWAPEDPPAVAAFGQVYLDPARPKAALESAIVKGMLSDADAKEMQDNLPLLERAASAKAAWEQAAKAAGIEPGSVAATALAEVYGVGRGGAGIAGAMGAGAIIRGLALKNPYAAGAAVVAGSALGGYAAGKGYDLAAEKLGDYVTAIGAAATAKGVDPEAAARGELATLILPLPGSMGKLAAGTSMVAAQKGTRAAAEFVAKNVGAGAGAGAATSLVLQGVESAVQGQNLFNLESTEFGAALGAVLSGANLRFTGYKTPQIVSILQQGLNYQRAAAYAQRNQQPPPVAGKLTPRQQEVFDAVVPQLRALGNIDPRSLQMEARQVEGFGPGATEVTTAGMRRSTKLPTAGTAATPTPPAAAAPPPPASAAVVVAPSTPPPPAPAATTTTPTVPVPQAAPAAAAIAVPATTAPTLKTTISVLEQQLAEEVKSFGETPQAAALRTALDASINKLAELEPPEPTPTAANVAPEPQQVAAPPEPAPVAASQPAGAPETPTAATPSAEVGKPDADTVRQKLDTAASKLGIRYDGVTPMGDDGFYLFSDTTSQPGKVISFTIESKTPPTQAEIAERHAAKLKEFAPAAEPVPAAIPTLESDMKAPGVESMMKDETAHMAKKSDAELLKMIEGQAALVKLMSQDIEVSPDLTILAKTEISPFRRARIGSYYREAKRRGLAVPESPGLNSYIGAETPAAPAALPAPAPEKPTFKWKFPDDDFGGETTPIAFAVMDMGGVLSKSGAKKAKRLEGNEDLWESQFKPEHPTHNKVFKVKGQAPDQVAQQLYEMNLIPEPTADAMWSALQKESTSSRKAKLDRGRRELAEMAAGKRAEAFDKAAADPKSGVAVPVNDLAVGDSVTVAGEPFKVTEIDADGNVTIEDGKKFGVQEVQDGEVIYGEHVKAPESDASEDPFALETTTDEQLKAEQLTADQKAIIAARQQAPLTGSAGDLTADLFGEGQTPLFNENRAATPATPTAKVLDKPAATDPQAPLPAPTAEPTSTVKPEAPPSDTAPAIKPDKTGNLTGDNHRLMAMMNGERSRLERLADFRGAEDAELAAAQAITDVLSTISEKDAQDTAKVKAALTTRVNQITEDQRRKAEALKRGGKEKDLSIDDPEAQQLKSKVDTEIEAARGEMADAIAKAAEGLPAKDRELLFGMSQGQSLAAMAKALGISPQAVSKRWEKVQSKMAKKLEQYRKLEGALLLPGGRIGSARIPVPASTAGSVLVDPYAMSKAQRRLIRAWLGKHGAFPPEMREQLRKAGLSEAEMKNRYSLIAKDLSAAIDAQVGRNGSQAREALLNRVTQFLDASAAGSTAGALRGDSVRVQDTAMAMRQAIDTGSQLLVQEGAVNGLLANIIVGNFGGWMRQYHAAFDPEANWNLDALKERAAGTGPAATKAKSILDRAELEIYQEETRAGRPNNPEDIEAIMRGLTDRASVEHEMFGTGGGTGRSNISSYLRRQTISPALRDLMGQETNPVLRAEKSGAFLSQAIARHRAQQALAQVGLQTGAFSLIRRGRYSVAVPAPNPGRNPFRGLWTTPEFSAAMTEAALYAHDLHTATGMFNRLWRWYVGETKINLVVLNPRSTVANAIGGGIQSIANGMFIPFTGGAGWGEGAKLAFDAVFRGDGTIDPTAAEAAVKGRIRHIHSVALRAGMIDSNVTVRDFETTIGEQLALQDLDASERRIDRTKGAARGLITGYAGTLAATGSVLAGAAGGVAGAVGGAIAGSERISNAQRMLGRNIIGKPDAFWKTWSLIDNFAQGLERGMNLDDAINFAADRTRGSMPSYDAIPEGLRLVAARVPFVNIFFQFSWELVRNNVNNIRFAVEDLRDSNPVAKKHGAKRLMGVAMLAGLLYGLYDHQRRKHNWTPQKDVAARRSFLPSWDSKGVILPTKVEGTKVSYVNGRYLAPQLVFAEAAQAAMEGKNAAAVASESVGAFLDDFVRSNAAVDPAIEAATNRKTDTGKPITSETGAMGALERVNHLLKRTMTPGVATEAGKIRMAATGESAGYGRKYTMLERAQGMLGLRVNTYDFKDQLGFRLSDLDRKWNEISKTENGEKKKISDMKKDNPSLYAERAKEIAEKAKRQRGELQLAAVQLYADALEVGISDREITVATRDKKTKLPMQLRLSRIARRLRAQGRKADSLTPEELQKMRDPNASSEE